MRYFGIEGYDNDYYNEIVEAVRSKQLSLQESNRVELIFAIPLCYTCNVLEFGKNRL